MSEDSMVWHFRGLRVDLPRSIGFYGGIAVAVTAGVIEPPLGLFIAAVPIAKMALNSRAPSPLRWVGQVFDGAAKPVGGDGQGTIRLADPDALASEAAETVALAKRASPEAKAEARKQAAARTDQAVGSQD
ncbi:MAG: hypothetical protein ACYC1D_05510 [Acidimicrobiales bacterium]